jgi:taurine dioxygenase
MSMRVKPFDAILGATVQGLDLSKPLSDTEQEFVRHALANYGLLRFPEQQIREPHMVDFAGRFGSLEVNVAVTSIDQPYPEIMTLSNIVENGKKIGLSDAGQGWHTDMSYSEPIALANMLYGMKVPMRDGKPLGDTQFADMSYAYDTLPAQVQARIEHLTAEHDFNKFWEMMRAKPGSDRPPLTPAQRAKKPPVVHPVVMRHPVSRRKVLYCNPGYATRVIGLSPTESDELLQYLFEHQLQQRFLFSFKWTELDVLLFDNIRTLHNAIPDYQPHEHRLMKRCQIMADKVFEQAVEMA